MEEGGSVMRDRHPLCYVVAFFLLQYATRWHSLALPASSWDPPPDFPPNPISDYGALGGPGCRSRLPRAGRNMDCVGTYRTQRLEAALRSLGDLHVLVRLRCPLAGKG